MAEETREPQYQRCVELRDTEGLASLGLMSNQTWHDDPKRLVFMLARYKFCLLYTSPSPRDGLLSRMPSSA